MALPSRLALFAALVQAAATLDGHCRQDGSRPTAGCTAGAAPGATEHVLLQRKFAHGTLKPLVPTTSRTTSTTTPRLDPAAASVRPFDCSRYTMPIQVLLEADQSYGVRALDLASGSYSLLWKVPLTRTNPPYLKINGCAIGPLDSLVYCSIDMGSAGTFVVRLDDQRVQFVASVPWSYRGAFNRQGTLYLVSGSTLYAIPRIHTLPGYGDQRDPALPSTSGVAATSRIGQTGADIVVVNADYEGTGVREYLVSADNGRVYVSTASGEPRTWCLQPKASSALPPGTYGAAWQYQNRIFFGNNAGSGIFEVKMSSADFATLTVEVQKVGRSVVTNHNDGMSCTAVEAPWPRTETGTSSTTSATSTGAPEATTPGQSTDATTTTTAAEGSTSADQGRATTSTAPDSGPTTDAATVPPSTDGDGTTTAPSGTSVGEPTTPAGTTTSPSGPESATTAATTATPIAGEDGTTTAPLEATQTTIMAGTTTEPSELGDATTAEVAATTGAPGADRDGTTTAPVGTTAEPGEPGDATTAETAATTPIPGAEDEDGTTTAPPEADQTTVGETTLPGTTTLPSEPGGATTAEAAATTTTLGAQGGGTTTTPAETNQTTAAESTLLDTTTGPNEPGDAFATETAAPTTTTSPDEGDGTTAEPTADGASSAAPPDGVDGTTAGPPGTTAEGTSSAAPTDGGEDSTTAGPPGTTMEGGASSTDGPPPTPPAPAETFRPEEDFQQTTTPSASDAPAPPTTTAGPVEGTCVLWGDPHIRVFDNRAATLPGFDGPVVNMYDVGDFWVVKSKEVYIQGRYRPTRWTNGQAATSALAVGGPFLQGHTLVVESMAGGVTWDGRPILEANSSSFAVSGLVSVQLHEGPGVRSLDPGQARLKVHAVEVDLPLAVRLTVDRWAEHVDAMITMRQQPGGQDGHCGNFNGDASDDGTKDIEGRIGGQVDSDLLLFPPTGFVAALHPKQVTLEDCPAEVLARARELCSLSLAGQLAPGRAGEPSPDEPAADTCVFDVCFGGEEYAQADATVHEQLAAAPLPAPIRWAARPDFCLDVGGGVAADGALLNGAVLQLWRCKDGHPDMQFLLPAAGEGLIRWAAHPGKCLEVAGGVTNARVGARVQLWDCDVGDVHRRFRVVGGRRIQWVTEPGLCLTVSSGLAELGSKVELGPCSVGADARQDFLLLAGGARPVGPTGAQ